jgi:acyl homoserine lactone synthase
MIRFLFADQLHKYPKLRDTLFQDRAYQFKTRLNWAVDVDENGFETDQYDAMNPLYVIWEMPDGRHGGSMRLMPITGRCMINQHFGDLLVDGPVNSPLIWESMRFCLSRHAKPRTANALMLAGGEFMKGCGVKQYVGVFDQRMIRIYRMIGASPKLLGQTGQGSDFIGIGLWSYDTQLHERVSKIAGISLEQSLEWFEQSFGANPQIALVG